MRPSLADIISNGRPTASPSRHPRKAPRKRDRSAGLRALSALAASTRLEPNGTAQYSNWGRPSRGREARRMVYRRTRRMPTIRLITLIHATVEVCFDLARSVDAHVVSAAGTDERAVEGVTQGLVTLGDEVTWEATHFAVRQRLRVRISEFDPPRRFTDEMVRGSFRRMRHVHEFEPTDEGTRMSDAFEYELPFGPVGWFADVVAVKRHMTRFLVRRNATLKSLAEGRARR